MEAGDVLRQMTKPRAVAPTSCSEGDCSVKENSLDYRSGPLGDFWDYWKSKGLEVPDRYYGVLDRYNGETPYNDLENMCPVFREKLVPNYDVGVGIAKGAMIFSYMLDRHGLPMLVVKQSADHSTKDGEATWEPIDKIDKEAIGGKDVLLVDIDVLTGKTVRRAADELRKFNPRKLDLFLRLGPERHVKRSRFYFDENGKHFLDGEDGLDTRERIPRGFDNVLFYEELKAQS